MIGRINKGRSTRAFLISAIIHLCFLIALTIVLYRSEPGKIKDSIGVEFVKEKTLSKPRRKLLKPPPPKRLLVPRQIQSTIANQPQTVKLEASTNPIDETIHPSNQPLLHSATPDQINPQETLPDVTTAARQLNSRETPIPESVSSRFQTSEGEGVESFRQRVHGKGSGGLGNVESTGASDIGTVGDRPSKRGTGPGGGITGDSPFAQALRRIADHIIATREKDQIDVLFVLDTSASMQDNIQQVADNLYSMTDAFDDAKLEYYLGMSEFSVRREGQQVKTISLMPDVGLLHQQMKEIRLSGDEHALDALVDTLNAIEFHSDAEKHLVLVTDEPATTSLKKPDALEEMREKVTNNCKLEGIHVNVLGYTEVFQKRLAEETGGLWQEIPGGLTQTASLPASRTDNEKFIKVFREIVTDIRRNSGRLLFSMDLKFQSDLDSQDNLVPKEILKLFQNNGSPLSAGAIISIQQAGNSWLIVDDQRTYTVKKGSDKLNVYIGITPEAYGAKATADIVIMLDYSRSMGGKSQAVMLGISTLIGRLDLLPVNYRIWLIRFAEAKDAIKAIDGAVITPVPVNEAQIKSLMETPFGGDEHLIDAIVEGLPQIRFRPGASHFLLVLTDEPSTGSQPPERAIETCQSLGVRAYVIGFPGEDFQSTLAHQTDGLFFPMPNYLSKAYPNQ